jgi:transposase
MSSIHLEWNPVDGQLGSLWALVEELRREVGELRAENAELRQQVSSLKCDVGYWKSRHADVVERNTKLQAELNEAKAEIRQLRDERFGKKSEKKYGTDRTNRLEDPQEQLVPAKKRGRQPGSPAPKRRDYSHLPVRIEELDVPDDAKVCACCGLPLEALGHNADSEQIEIETVTYRRVMRRKRYRRICECVDQPRTITAMLPAKLLPKSLCGTSVWIHLLLEKFYLQRPMHRIRGQLQLLGLNLAPGTIADGLRRIEPMLTPVYNAIRTRQAESVYWHADETRWYVFKEKSGKKGCHWWLWLFAGDDAVAYVLDATRSHDVPESHFGKLVEGVLVVDRYSVYKAMAQVKSGKLLLAFCWAHVRRDFVRVGKGYPELKDWALAWLLRIRELYGVNRERLRHSPGTNERAAAELQLRQHVATMASQRDTELSDKTLRQPCSTVLVSLSEHWNGLTLFVNDSRVPMDNNYGERLMRGPAVGRKNYYGSGSEWSGRMAMMLFSIFATLALWKINPRRWLNLYFEECAQAGSNAPPNVADFLPWNLSPTRLSEFQAAMSVNPVANSS